jgi:hypothetical protein
MANSLRLLVMLYGVAVTPLALWYSSLENLLTLTGKNRTSVRQIIPEIFHYFKNETGTENGTYPVPNIIHLLRFKNNNFAFVDEVCVLLAFKYHHPDKILFHTDVDIFIEPYWEKVKNTPEIVYELRKVILPDTIFGQKFSKRYHVYTRVM